MSENTPSGGTTPPKKEQVRINLPPKPTTESPVKRTGNYTTPGGIEEFYGQDGILEVRTFPNGITESYDKEGRLTNRTNREGVIILPTLPPTPESKGLETPPAQEQPAPTLEIEHRRTKIRELEESRRSILERLVEVRVRGRPVEMQQEGVGERAIKSQEEIQLEEKLETVRKDLRQEKGTLAALAVIQEGETESPSTVEEEKVNLPDGKKPSRLAWLRRKGLPIGLATVLTAGAGGGGYLGGKKLGWWGSGPAPAREKTERKSDTGGATNEIYKIPAETNLTALAREATNAAPALETNAPKVTTIESAPVTIPPPTPESTSTNQPPTLTIEQLKAKIQAGFEEELEKKQAEIDAMKARLAVIEKEKSKKPTSSAKPIEKNLGEMTDAEFLAHIRAKLNKGIDINEAVETGVNAMRWNRLIQQERN